MFAELNLSRVFVSFFVRVGFPQKSGKVLVRVEPTVNQHLVAQKFFRPSSLVWSSFLGLLA